MPVRARQDGGEASLRKRKRLDQRRYQLAPVHPHGIKPSGNALFSSVPNRRLASLGRLAALSDEELLVIFSQLEPEQWAQMQSVSHACRAFALYEPHWREAVVAKTGGHLTCWGGSWRDTYVDHFHVSRAPSVASRLASRPIRAQGLFSDALFLPLQLASSPLDKYTPSRVAAKRPFRALDKVRGSKLGRDGFMSQYASQGRPCLIVEDEAQANLPKWSLQDMKIMLGSRRIRAEALTMNMSCYTDYARSCQDEHFSWIPDESPFYLFDPTLARSMQRQGLFVVPALLTKEGSMDHSVMRKDWDLFSLLQEQRPDHAWVIAGPSRSGSGWHLDPNNTSAYNTVLSGRKLWMLLPPHVTPPGVFISADGGSVTAPLSIIEWLVHFWDECVRLHGRHGDDTLLVDVCGAGETLFVPAGWRHLVINLDESVAFTQNFVSPAELPAVLDFLKNRPEQISGFRLHKNSAETKKKGEESESDLELDELPENGIQEKRALFDLFVERLGRFDPALRDKALQDMRLLEQRNQQQTVTTAIARDRRDTTRPSSSSASLWDSLKGETVAAPLSHFSLDLAGEELEEGPW